MSEKEKAIDILTEKSNHWQDDDSEGLPAPGSQGRLLAERRLVRKLDVRLIPTIFLIFIMNYIDVSLVFSEKELYLKGSCFNSAVELQLHD